MNDYQYINENGSPRDYYEIVNENGELCKEIERLNNIINKAREYIESKVVSSNEVIDQLRKSEVRELLDFLVGSDKE